MKLGNFTWSVGNWSRFPAQFPSDQVRSFVYSFLWLACWFLCHDKISTAQILRGSTSFSSFHMWSLTARIWDVTSQRRLRLPSWCYQNTFQVVVIKVQGLQFWPNFCDVVLDTRKWKLKKGGFWWLISSIQANKKKLKKPRLFWKYSDAI